MKYESNVYHEWNPFSGVDRDSDIRVYSWKMVKTKKIHNCALAELIGKESWHEIPPDKFAMREHAIVDGMWESTYSCLDCMDWWLDELKSDGFFE